jgi:hypothetical protein
MLMMTATLIRPVPLGQPAQVPALTYPLVTEEHLTADTKLIILSEWRTFILSGFAWPYFTVSLYKFLVGYGQFSPQDSREAFWLFWFKNPAHFRIFLNQFGGTKIHAETGTYDWWNNSSAVDLKRAMAEEMTRVYHVVLQILADLENSHNTIAGIWLAHAQKTKLPIMTYPEFEVDGNAHNMISYAIYIALSVPTPPLHGLQLIMPQLIPG